MFLKYLCKEYIIKTSMCFIGVCLTAAGVGAMRFADLGLDPFMSLANGIYLTIFKSLNINFGTSFLLFSFLLVFIVLIFDRSKLGLGTIFNMSLSGYISEFGLNLLKLIFIQETMYFIIRVTIMIFGILIIAIGSGIYFNTYIGVSPYDATGFIITQKIGNQKIYRWIRIGTDVICVSAGFFMGSIPGIGTIIMAFFTGPLFYFFQLRFLTLGKRAKIITW
jgi:uncharacterized membrane protein YczE